MKNIAATLLVSLAAGTFAHPALAQSKPAAPAAAAPAAKPVDPKAAAAARELLDAMEYRATTAAALKQMIDNMPAMMRAGAQNQIRSSTALTEKQKTEKLAELDKMVPQATAAISKTLNDPKLMDEMLAEMVPLYARHFTPDEMKQLAAFYRTPIGRKSLKEMPQLMGEGMQVGQRIVGPRINKVMQELNAKQQAQNPAPAKK